MKTNRVGVRIVDLAFVGLALICISAIPHVRPIYGKVMIGCWAVASVAGLFLRWGWLFPGTIGIFFAVQSFQPFLNGYSHGAEENVWHDLIYPTVCASIMAAVQIAFSYLTSDSQPESPDRRKSDRPPVDMSDSRDKTSGIA